MHLTTPFHLPHSRPYPSAKHARRFLMLVPLLCSSKIFLPEAANVCRQGYRREVLADFLPVQLRYVLGLSVDQHLLDVPLFLPRVGQVHLPLGPYDIGLGSHGDSITTEAFSNSDS